MYFYICIYYYHLIREEKIKNKYSTRVLFSDNKEFRIKLKRQQI